MKKLLNMVLVGLLGINLVGCGPKDNNEPVSLVTMDVNPSVQLHLDKEDEVIEALAVNKEAEIILKDMNLKEVDVDVALHAIVGSMVKNGYLTASQNTVILSVENQDGAERIRLEKALSAEISALLETLDIDSAILTQDLDIDEDLEKIVKKYDISYGKAELIEEILEEDRKNYKIEDLVKLSTKELVLIYNKVENKEDANRSVLSGKVDTSEYITKEEALAVTLKDADLEKSAVQDLEIEFDYEHGRLTYEVSFKANGYEYEYEIDVLDKSISREVEVEDDNRKGASVEHTGGTTYITKEDALVIALNHAGLKKTEVREIDVELDKEGSMMVYEVSFETNTQEYDYVIDAVNKKIVHVGKERND